MKFGTLPIGQRFRWRDAVYVKTSPILALAEASETTQMVPRSATVHPLTEERMAETERPSSATLAQEVALAALKGFHQDSLNLIENLTPALTPEQLEQLRRALDAAQRRAITALGLPVRR